MDAIEVAILIVRREPLIGGTRIPHSSSSTLAAFCGGHTGGDGALRRKLRDSGGAVAGAITPRELDRRAMRWQLLRRVEAHRLRAPGRRKHSASIIHDRARGAHRPA